MDRGQKTAKIICEYKFSRQLEMLRLLSAIENKIPTISPLTAHLSGIS